MLSQKSLQTARGVAESLVEDGVILTLTPTSLLSEVVAASRSPFDETSFAGSPLDTGLLYAVNVTAGDSAADSIHTVALEDLAEKIGELAVPHLRHARTVVAPIVTSFNDAVTARILAHKPHDPASDYNIIQVDMPEILKDASFLESLKKITAGQDLPPNLPLLNIGDFNADQVQSLVGAGLPDFADDIKKAILNIPEQDIKAFWNMFYNSGTADSRPIYSFLSETPYKRAQAFLLLYAVSMGLEQNVPESLKEISLAALRSDLDVQVRYAAVALNIAVNQIKGNRTAGSLVVRYDFDGKSAQVDSDLYAKFLEDGGEPDTLLGAILDRDQAHGSAALLETSKDRIRSWSDYVALVSKKHADEFVDWLRVAYKAELIESLKTLDSSEIEVNPSQGRYIDDVCAKAEKCLAEATEAELKDVPAMSLCLIAGVRFSHTSAKEILSDIQSACCNGEVDPREAATVAFSKYVSRFLASQIALV